MQDKLPKEHIHETTLNYERVIDLVFSVLDNPLKGQTTIPEEDREKPIADKVYSDPNNIFV